MADIYLKNSLTRKKEKFEPINSPKVGMYSCGPTVYDYITIGNFRTYITADILLRTLKYAGYKVDYIMNITDVGHLTGDNLGDADTGEDKIEKSARREGKSAGEIAEFYTDIFLKDYNRLNLIKPRKFTKATEHIKEQINLIEKLEKKDFAYKISDGIYFDIQEFEKKTDKKYGELSTLDKIKEGARVEKNPEKKDARDFALWKFSPKKEKRQMEWDSPWGVGFPGWHIECSAMSMKYLGPSFDIHVGGEDLRQTHHPNEIAQSESVTGKPFVKYWIHTTFLQVDGQRMGKSLGNFYTVDDIKKKGFDAPSLRYLYLTAHYRDPLNFTWEGLKSANNALTRLRNQMKTAKVDTQRRTLSEEKCKRIEKYRREFQKAIYDDLNTPRALAVLWEMMKSNIPSSDKYDLAINFDEILGLNLAFAGKSDIKVPKDVQALTEEREKLRKAGDFKKADKIRKKILKKGFVIEDIPEGPKIRPAT